jgi:hypothetical protein
MMVMMVVVVVVVVVVVKHIHNRALTYQDFLLAFNKGAAK